MLLSLLRLVWNIRIPGIGPVGDNLDFLVAKLNGNRDPKKYGKQITATHPYLTVAEARDCSRTLFYDPAPRPTHFNRSHGKKENVRRLFFNSAEQRRKLKSGHIGY